MQLVATSEPTLLSCSKVSLGCDQQEQGRELLRKRSISNSSLSTQALQDWDCEEFCDGHSAEDKAKMAVENNGLSMVAARLRVMREFPSSFSSAERPSIPLPEVAPSSVETLALETGLLSTASSIGPEDWDPEIWCLGNTAGDRAKWVAITCDISLEQAQLLVMRLFPAQFGHRHHHELEAYYVMDLVARIEECLVSTMCPEPWAHKDSSDGEGAEDGAVWADLSLDIACLSEEEVAGSIGSSSTCGSSSISRVQTWDYEIFCDGFCAGDRASWLVENCGQTLEEAQLQVMQEFPTQFCCPRTPGIGMEATELPAFGDSDVEHAAADEEDVAFAAEGKRTRGRCRGRAARIARRLREGRQGPVKVVEQSTSPAAQLTRRLVPKSLNFAEEFSKSEEGAEPPTTMMLRNIPNRYTQEELLEELEDVGFASSFDFFYSPMDFGNMGNTGYAFVNFVSAAWAARCEEELHGHTFRKHQQKSKTKVAAVSVAYLQGLQANLRHYERTAVVGRRPKRGCPIVINTATSQNIDTSL